jgi:hypothetical protein
MSLNVLRDRLECDGSGVKVASEGADRFNTMNGEGIDLSYEFGPFRLEPATRRLLRAGESLP